MTLAWRFYDEQTGIVCPQAMWLPSEDAIEANTPPGCIAIFGEIDHLSQRIDLATRQLVDYQPPAPLDTERSTWSWDAEIKRWSPVATTAAIAADVRAERDARLAACDWVVMRAMETSAPVSDGWRDYRQALRDISAQPGFPSAVEWPTAPN